MVEEELTTHEKEVLGYVMEKYVKCGWRHNRLLHSLIAQP